jgi:hypothetical protein
LGNLQGCNFYECLRENLLGYEARVLFPFFVFFLEKAKAFTGEDAEDGGKSTLACDEQDLGPWNLRGVGGGSNQELIATS